MKRFWRIVMLLMAVVLAAIVSFNLTAVRAITGVPKVILISLDGANPDAVKNYLDSGILRSEGGFARLQRYGVTAKQNVTITPSVTAPGHIAIATGARAARNDIIANRFHLVVSRLIDSVSGFAAPIGGYQIATPPTVSSNTTAEPLWVKLLASGKKVATATWPGGDGVDIKEPTSGAILQPASLRTVTYTVPFGAFAGVGAQGFSLTRNDFSEAPAETVDRLNAAGRASFSPILQKTAPLETFAVQGITYTIQVAALDTTNDAIANYDTLVFFDTANGIKPGPFSLPATGPAYVKASDRTSSRFYLEGSAGKAGTAYYVSFIAPDLSTVRLARYAANSIPRNGIPAVLANVDDINANVGFWAPQPDFRIPERLSPGFANFPDLELEAMYEDQVQTFVDYQTNIGLRAISQNPDAALVMIYIEQPDGSGHQFTLTDPRQATDFTNPATIGSGQDRDKIRRYDLYRQVAYQTSDRAVKRIIDAVGSVKGVPRSNVIVVSDHGMAPFHTAVNLNNLLASSGIDTTKVRAYSTGPAVNVYINLQGRESGGTVNPTEYHLLQRQIFMAFRTLTDNNLTYNSSLERDKRIFDLVVKRPGPTGIGTNALIGQDSGDIFAILKPGYNFDGTQNPVVFRQGDAPSAAPVFSVPNFYGGHGYDSELPEMSAIFLAAGPNIRSGISLRRVRNIDVAPTILKILRVKPDETVQGRALNGIIR
jgi:predicted AlkP superfamily pyrophosphatase or phosphodiesterase